MAKKKKDKKEEKEDKKGAGSVIAIIVVALIILVWIAIFSILVKLDIGGLGTMLRPTLKNIPVINTILPNTSDEEGIWEEDYPYANVAQAMERIKELEEQIAALTDGDNSYLETIAELSAEVNRLKVFEDNVLEFEERVKKFDYEVVFSDVAPDISEYKTFYEGINPTTAEEIYRLVIQQLQFDQGIQDMATLLTSMKASKAAAIMEESTADIELLCQWLLCMKPKDAATILDKMDGLFGAKILRKMADMNEENAEAIKSQISSE